MNIQGLAVKLTANVAGFASGMNSAARPVAAFASSVAGTSLKIGGLVASLGGLISTGAFIALVKSSIDSISALNDQSAAIGISTLALSRLQYASSFAGVGTEEMNASLIKMQKNLGDAQAGTGPAADAFRALGLDATKLAGQAPEKTFGDIAQAMTTIENPTQRVGLAMDIFGKAGAGLLPVLLQGRDAITATGLAADKMAVSVSDVDAAKVDIAGDSIDNLGKLMGGVGNAIAVELSPFITEAANRLIGFATAGDGVGANVGTAFQTVASGIGYVMDFTNLLTAGFYGFRSGAVQALASIIGAVDTLGSSLVALSNMLPGVHMQWTDTFKNLKQGMEQEAAADAAKFDVAWSDFNTGKSSTAAAKFFEDIQAKGKAAAEQAVIDGPKMGGAFKQLEHDSNELKKVADNLAKLQSELTQFGMTDSQKKMADMSALGATPAQLQQANELLAVKDKLTGLTAIDTGNPMTDFAAKMEQLQKLYQQGKITADQFANVRETANKTMTSKLEEQAKGVIDSVKTPLEAFNEEMDKLQTLLDQKLIAQDVFDKAGAKAKLTLTTASKDNPSPLNPQAMRAGSADAMKLAFDNSRGVQMTAPKDEVAKKQLTEQEQMNVHLKAIAGSVKDAGANLTTVDIA